MTHEEAIIKSAVSHQKAAANCHAACVSHKSEGREYLARLYANWAAEESAIARALMRIEGGEE